MDYRGGENREEKGKGERGRERRMRGGIDGRKESGGEGKRTPFAKVWLSAYSVYQKHMQRDSAKLRKLRMVLVLDC